MQKSLDLQSNIFPPLSSCYHTKLHAGKRRIIFYWWRSLHSQKHYPGPNLQHSNYWSHICPIFLLIGDPKELYHFPPLCFLWATILWSRLGWQCVTGPRPHLVSFHCNAKILYVFHTLVWHFTTTSHSRHCAISGLGAVAGELTLLHTPVLKIMLQSIGKTGIMSSP